MRTRWIIATAFTRAASSLRISQRERAIIIKRAEGLDGLEEQLLEARNESSRHAELYREFINELSDANSSQLSDRDCVITIVDSEYPQRLLHTDQPPSILFCRGENLAILNDAFLVTVIGTRNPSFYGLEVTNKLCAELVRRGITIVSGGARGIDGQAHKAAIKGGTATVSVLGCGIDVTYPKEHSNLFEKISRIGVLISEYSSGTMPRRHHFPARNRILAGLSDAVLVTEASRFSGTLITAGFAADYGRDVCAVPGSILSGSSRSCHDLIREGAVIVESIDDIPQIPAHPAYCNESDSPKSKSERSARALNVHIDLGEDELCILNLLDSAPRTLHALSEHCRLDLRATALSLATLQSKGFVQLYRGLYVRSGGN
ncbi:MAG TPA: DNA-protecting protein DprA [Clostridiaceae bacterium]|nr:DNA-protecting protein DprA [Clostridiaceae bacterium]